MLSPPDAAALAAAVTQPQAETQNLLDFSGMQLLAAAWAALVREERQMAAGLVEAIGRREYGVEEFGQAMADVVGGQGAQ